MQEFLQAVAKTSFKALNVLGFILHIYTTILAYQLSGFLAAVVTFATPPFAEFYWAYELWGKAGNLWSNVAIGLALWIGLAVLAFVCGWLAGRRQS